MSQSSMTCADERQLGSELAEGLGYANTRSSFQDSGYNPQKILKTALEESTEKGGLEDLPLKDDKRFLEHVFPILLAPALYLHMAQHPGQEARVLKKMLQCLPSFCFVAL